MAFGAKMAAMSKMGKGQQAEAAMKEMMASKRNQSIQVSQKKGNEAMAAKRRSLLGR